MPETLTLQLPEPLYRRLLDTAQAMHRPLEEIVLRVLEIGSPPSGQMLPPNINKNNKNCSTSKMNAIVSCSVKPKPPQYCDGGVMV